MTADTICAWIRDGDLEAVVIRDRYYVPRRVLVDRLRGKESRHD